MELIKVTLKYDPKPYVPNFRITDKEWKECSAVIQEKQLHTLSSSPLFELTNFDANCSAD